MHSTYIDLVRSRGGIPIKPYNPLRIGGPPGLFSLGVATLLLRWVALE